MTMGKPGLMSHPNIPDSNLTTGDWLNSDPDEIIADVYEMLSTIYVANGGVGGGMRGKKFQIVLGSAYWLVLNTTQAYPDTNNLETIEQALTRNPLYGGSFEAPQLDTTAGGASDFVVCGPFTDPESITFELSVEPMPLRPNTADPLKTQQTIFAKVAGLQVKYPLRFLQCDGLNA
jgi:hypothetical protein